MYTSELRAAHAALPGLRSRLFCEQLSAAHTDQRPIARGRMRLTPELLLGFEDADFYLCGPEAFMREQWRALVALGVSPLRIQREVFGPFAARAPGLSERESCAAVGGATPVLRIGDQSARAAAARIAAAGDRSRYCCNGSEKTLA